jgi:hypothetical protein
MATAAEARTYIDSRREKDVSKEAARLECVGKRARMDWRECAELATALQRNKWRLADKSQLLPWLRHVYSLEY